MAANFKWHIRTKYLLYTYGESFGESVLKQEISRCSGYYDVKEMFKALNFPIELIAVTKDDIVFDELYNKRSSLIYVTPSHQYPFGTAFDLIKVAINSLGSYTFIIEDDYDGEY